MKWVIGDPSTIFLATSFNRKMPENSDSIYSSIFMLEIKILPKEVRIHKKLWILFQFSWGHWESIIGKKIPTFLVI